MKRHFRVVGVFDGSRPLEGTVTIDEHGDFIVRPKHRKRTFSLPLSTVADLVVFRVVASEVREKRRLRAEARKARRKEKAR